MSYLCSSLEYIYLRVLLLKWRVGGSPLETSFVVVGGIAMCWVLGVKSDAFVYLLAVTIQFSVVSAHTYGI